MTENESVFQDQNYFFLMGKAAGKQARQIPETKYQATNQAKAEFDRRKLLKHEKFFIDGYVTAIRDGFFSENEHIEAVSQDKKEK